jgi:hypothetical protein
LTFQQARFIETERQKVSEDDLKNYFNVAINPQHVPPLFVWNANEARFGVPTKRAPGVTVSKQTEPGIATAAEDRDGNQLTLSTGISTFGDSAPPMFVRKLLKPKDLQSSGLFVATIV